MSKQCPECMMHSGTDEDNHSAMCSWHPVRKRRVKEVYHSTTHGPIPLSFTGRLLMQNLRFAIQKAIARGDWHDPREEISFARGELAKYISALENASNAFTGKEFSIEERLARIESRLNIK
jgi:hypothetical protein